MELHPNSFGEPYEGAYRDPYLQGSLEPSIEVVANKTAAIVMLVGIISNLLAMGRIRTITAAIALDIQNFKGSY
jgi:hypothetical protein